MLTIDWDIWLDPAFLSKYGGSHVPKIWLNATKKNHQLFWKKGKDFHKVKICPGNSPGKVLKQHKLPGH